MTSLRSCCVAVAIMLGLTGAGYAQTYPNRPVKIIVPFAAGGQFDTIGRPIAEHLARTLGQPFIIQSMPGAGGTIGASFVARAEPDGHTLLFGGTSALAIAPAVSATLPYDPLTAFEPVVLATDSPMLLLVNPKLNIRSVADLLRYAKDNPDKLAFGSAGIGTPPHLVMEKFLKAAGIQANHIPYRGGALALQDTIAGQVNMTFETTSQAMVFVQAGSLTPLIVTTAERIEQLPDVPTAKQAGYEDLVLTAWTAFVAPANTPKAIVEKLNVAINEQLRRPEMLQVLTSLNARPLGGTTGDFRTRWTRELKIWGELGAPFKQSQ